MKVLNKVKSVMFVLANYFMSLFLPVVNIDNLPPDVKLLPVMREDVGIVNAIYKETLGNGKDMLLSNRLILSMCGDKLGIKLLYKGVVVGYMYYYFHVHEVCKFRRIHLESVGIIDKYKGLGLGRILYKNCFSWFCEKTFLNGISARYRVLNIPAKKLHESNGFKEQERYFVDNEEWIYGVKSVVKEK